MSSPKSLYKFVTPERVDVLATGLIRFTQPSALNDPFELRPVFEGFLTEAQIVEATNPTWEMLEDALRQRYATLPSDAQALYSIDSIVQLVKGSPHLIEKSLAPFAAEARRVISDFTPHAREILSKALQTKVGILSLSESVTNPLLWAHYASSHKGFAFELSSNHPYFSRRRSESDELYHLRKVKYVDRRDSGRALSEIDGDDLFVTKETSWKYEEEWRMLALLDDAEEIVEVDGDSVYLFSFPMEAIRSVILGARSSELLCQRVRLQLASREARHIKVMRAELDTLNRRVVIT